MTAPSAYSNSVEVTMPPNGGPSPWLRQFGGAGASAQCYGIAIDGSGNRISTGLFLGPSINAGGTTLTNADTTAPFTADIWVAKHTSAGAPLWAKGYGGGAQDQPRAVACDSAGRIAVVGEFIGSMTVGSFTLTSAGASDIFVIVLDPAGNPVWAKSGGGLGPDFGYGVTFDLNGDVIVTGVFRNQATFGGIVLVSSAGGDNMFLWKLAGSNGAHLWAKNFESSSDNHGYGVTVDSANRITFCGDYLGMINFGYGQHLAAGVTGAPDMFIAKLESSGNPVPSSEPFKSKSTGGPNPDAWRVVRVDASGNIYAFGDFFTATDVGGGTITTGSGMKSAIAAKYNASGALQWSRKIAGSCSGLSMDVRGNKIALTGYFTFTITPEGGTSITSTGQFGASNIYLVEYDMNGNFLSVERYGGTSGSQGLAVAMDPAGTTTGGYFSGAATFGSNNVTAIGSNDAFIYNRQ